MLICEDLFLLLTTDEGGTEPWVSYRDYGLAAGLLADLTLAGCVDVEPGRWGQGSAKVSLAAEAGSASAGEALRAQAPPLAFGLEALSGRKPTPVSTLVTASWFNPRQAIVEGLVRQGIVDVVEKRMLGLVPEKHPTLNPQPEADTRARLLAALRGGGDPDRGGQGPGGADTSGAGIGGAGGAGAGGSGTAPGDALILSILDSLGAAPRVLRDEIETAGLRRGQVKKRIAEIAEALPAEAAAGGKAVASAIAGVQAAIGAAVAASAAAGAAASN
ncbi:GOLPH3/VPS74 family protein [Brevibacterium album]|uniref:GOLPH3/VPS74 family protein n=1 Tax=Brevibacterium album TaxID=417948 RepID=UPI0003F5D1FF|nr:GPP34 family phosphoprotein [Brevibacterium album]